MNYPLYNETLCPKVWDINEDGPIVKQDVRTGLLKVALDFVKELKVEKQINIKAEDVVMIGSITNYNWTPHSDIDLHIKTDYSKLDMSKEDAQTMFDAIKTAWNLKHNITIKGHDVELYVQDIQHVAVSSSEYSVLKNEWLKEPIKQKLNLNKELIKKKYKEFHKKINTLVNSSDDAGLKKLLQKLYKYRQAGLDSNGELSEENIVFKILRYAGSLDKLKDNIDKIYDKKVSVKENVLNEGAGNIAYTVFINAVNSFQRPDRNGNTMTMHVTPSPAQMKFLKGQSGSFMSGRSKVYFIEDPREHNKIKFTWSF